MHNQLPFMVKKTKTNKLDKLMPNLNNKEKYVVDIRALIQALKHELMLKKVIE